MTVRTLPLGLRWTFTDGLTLVGRELGRLRQEPGQIIAALIFPVVMVVLFGYVFGSAIRVPGGGDYREYLMPGLFSMVTFTAMQGVMGRMAADASRGVMDRFRSMPMARPAVPFGQTGADSLVGLPLLAMMVGTGLLVGWQPHRGLIPTAEAFLLMLLLRYALSWMGVYVGLVAKSEELVVQLAPLFLPVTMLSNAFVPTEGMPGWLRFVADWNPVSAITAAARELFGDPGVRSGHVAWPLAHPVAAVLLWSAALLVVFVPLSVRTYTRRGR
ncbi:ABC transporter permease [Actinoallomurus rhizosphaericola]|uniref:ABC transporter permease n=1 Tax=Actinoallomurus rhizosphaericola TaxID=2952536 RepID=UPI00209159FE|nr:ABC transporter permease [Actinoallomurus rhizosphaericola]MCO5992072.1 ABC transporter permease [Actinoallomurus rhizosphaericola]